MVSLPGYRVAALAPVVSETHRGTDGAGEWISRLIEPGRLRGRLGPIPGQELVPFARDAFVPPRRPRNHELHDFAEGEPSRDNAVERRNVRPVVIVPSNDRIVQRDRDRPRGLLPVWFDQELDRFIRRCGEA